MGKPSNKPLNFQSSASISMQLNGRPGALSHVYELLSYLVQLIVRKYDIIANTTGLRKSRRTLDLIFLELLDSQFK